MRDFTVEQLRSELLAIEADTYAEFVRSGRLNRELAPSLQQVIDES
jgi:CPA1 family monovalent cation:H+ antiporter